MDNRRFIGVLTPASSFCLLILTACIFLGAWFPPSWGEENGLIEMLQVFILVISGFAALGVYFKGVGSLATRRLMLCTVPAWILLVGRELSWGRVFYPNGKGSFISLKELWYGQYVYPIIAILFLGTLWVMRKQGLQREVLRWIIKGKFPIIDIIVFFVASVSGDIIEHHSGELLGQKEALLEEIAELVAYVAMMSLTINLGFVRRFQPPSENEDS
ncbi:MAG TPA: hypothetical protein VGL27_09170 [Negativicutes bacterium]